MESRVVVVTGSSSGIGQSIAEAFARSGDRLVVHGNRNLVGLAETIHRITSHSKETRAVVADISNADNIRRLVDMAFAWQNRVDVWVNAAGADVLTGDSRSLQFEEKLERLWQIDVKGTILISRAVAERMQNQERRSFLPSILNLSWDQAETGMEGDSGQFFSATKAAITAFSKSLAKTIGPAIRVNCIAPGWIQTAWGETASSDWNQRARSESMLDRWGRPEDIANVAWWLASPQCEFINGQTIAVNGGWKPPSMIPPNIERSQLDLRKGSNS